MKRVPKFILFVIMAIVSIYKGLRVTFRNMFLPSVTLQYPKQKQPMSKRFRGLVDLVPEKCVVCYQCVKICPTAALDLGHKYVAAPDNKKKLDFEYFKYNVELCCFCGLCEEICPTQAMYLNNIYEVASYSHDQLLHIDLLDPKKYRNFQTPEQQNAPLVNPRAPEEVKKNNSEGTI